MAVNREMTDEGMIQIQGHVFALLSAIRALIATNPNRDAFLRQFDLALGELRALAAREPSGHLWLPSAEDLARVIARNIDTHRGETH